ncbi:MAG: MFS transporter [Actinobacteria bacterium]|nr:MFS transporter [Actinomycetota bacterium]
MESPVAESPTTSDRRARLAGAVAYAGQGVCFAALVTRIPALKDRFGLDDASLALLLAVVPIVAGIGSVLAGSAASRIGAAPVLRVMGPVVPLALVAVGFSQSLPVLVAVLVVLGLGLGSVDAVMNAHGIAVEARYHRSIIASFYAVFSLAGIAGAGLAALSADSTLSLGLFFLLIAVALIPVQLIAGPFLLRGLVEVDGTVDEASPDHPAPGRVHIPWRPIVLIGIALTCVYIADSAASNWSAVYLTDGLGSAESVAALAYLLYALTTLVARVLVDRGVMLRGPVPLVRAGALIGVVAVLIVALAPTPAVGLIGFALLGIGVAPVIPLAFAAAGSHDPGGTGVAVARVNVFNYVGFVLGAPLIGIVAEVSSLRLAFALLVPLLLLAAFLAPHFAHKIVPAIETA